MVKMEYGLDGVWFGRVSLYLKD